MFIIAVAGLVVNLVGAFILKDSAKDDINIRGSFVHLLSDTFSSVVIVIGGALIIWKEWYFVDPILGLAISGVIGVWGAWLLRDSTHMLLEAAPRSLDVEALTSRLMAIDHVQAVHDLHLWEVSSGMYAMTCHVLVADMLLSEAEVVKDAVNKVASEEFKIGHTNLQFERSSRAQPPAED